MIVAKDSWDERNTTWTYIVCSNNCGWTYLYDSDWSWKKGDHWNNGICSQSVTKIGLICGKTEDTIESATIIF